MRHRKSGRKLNRNNSHRKALMRNLVTALIKHGRIRTTLPKAKELRSLADKMITLAKKGDLSSRRKAASIIFEKDVVAKLFASYPDLYKERNGGYTRIIKDRERMGDSAMMSYIEYVGYEQIEDNEEEN